MLYTHRGAQFDNQADFGQTHAGAGKASVRSCAAKERSREMMAEPQFGEASGLQTPTCRVEETGKDNLDLLLRLAEDLFGEGWDKVEIIRGGRPGAQVGSCVRMQKAQARVGGSEWDICEVVYEKADIGLSVEAGDPYEHHSIAQPATSEADPYGLKNPSEDMLALLYLG